MSLAALVARGPNDIMIPSLVFSSLEKGLEECKKILGEDYKTHDISGKTMYQWHLLKKEKKYKIDKEITDQLFTSYYDGCGGIEAVVLREVDEGTPFVAWNLD